MESFALILVREHTTHSLRKLAIELKIFRSAYDDLHVFPIPFHPDLDSLEDVWMLLAGLVHRTEPGHDATLSELSLLSP
mgnify:CR=1 FL=1